MLIIQYKVMQSDFIFQVQGYSEYCMTVKLGIINYPYFRHELINGFI